MRLSVGDFSVDLVGKYYSRGVAKVFTLASITASR